MAVVEMPASRSGPGARTTSRASGWGGWGLLRSVRGPEIDQHAAALDFDRKGRNAILLEARFADAAHAVELPVMPRADDVIAVETASPSGPPA